MTQAETPVPKKCAACGGRRWLYAADDATPGVPCGCSICPRCDENDVYIVGKRRTCLTCGWHE
jgi:hypothetical protein